MSTDKNSFKNIPFSSSWNSITEITEGWSHDLKFHIVSDKKMILRLSDISKMDVYKQKFEILAPIRDLDIPVIKPLQFGRCSYNGTEYCYSLFSWIEGSDADIVIDKLAKHTQYELGLYAGKILKELHGIPIIRKASNINWEEFFNKKLDRNIKSSNDCPIKVKGIESVVGYIEENRHLLKDRPVSFQHGDYHLGNMVLDGENLGVIDFNRQSVGDPWEEFNRITWCGHTSPNFAIGRIRGYFDNNVPDEFFKLLALYVASNQLSSVPWAMQFGKQQVDVMVSEVEKVLYDYDDFNNYIPKWYKNG